MYRSIRHSYFKIKSEINIVPLLDVLLVLLLTLITTTPIIAQNVQVNLPESTESQIVNTQNDPPFIIEIHGIGHYSVVVDKNSIDLLSSNQIIAEAKRRLSINPKTVFLIGGAKDVPYNEIIKILNLLHVAGIKSVGLMTRPI